MTLRRLLPIVEWLPRYDRRVAARRRRRRRRRHGADRPEEPRLRRHRRRAAAERPLRRGCGSAHLRAVLHLAADLHRPELVPGGGRRRRGARDRARRCAGGAARRGDHAGDRCAVPAARRLQAGLDRAVPLQGGRHRLPGRCGGRRRDRRAAEADRDVVRRRQRVAGARIVGRARSTTSTGRRSSSASGLWP